MLLKGAYCVGEHFVALQRVNNKQWPCKDRARPVIINEKKKCEEKFHKHYF